MKSISFPGRISICFLLLLVFLSPFLPLPCVPQALAENLGLPITILDTTGMISTREEFDWVDIEVTQPGLLDLEFTAVRITSWTYFTLYDPNGNELGTIWGYNGSSCLMLSST